MKKTFIFILIVSIVFSLSGCRGKTYNPSDYFLEMEYKDDFKILQLTDTHIAAKDDRERQYKFLEETISLGNPDLIVITGDIFTFATKTSAKEFFKFMDSFNVPWTLVFGNHDEQCYFSVEWVTRYLNKLTESPDSYCIFKDIQDDDVFGNSNFVINLKDGDTIKEQLIFLDSNRYHYGSYIGYDYIKEDQIEWYSNIVDETTRINGHLTESLLFFHIPVPEFSDAYDAAIRGDADAILEEGEKREDVCCPKYNSGFFDKVLEKGSSKAMFVGHDHVNNYRVLYKGIYLCYGVNSTDRIYFDEDLIGAQEITIHNDNSLSFNQIIRTYEEYE